MIRYVVLSVEPVLVEQKASARMKRLVLKSNKGKERDRPVVEKSRAVAAMAECVVVRERDLGMNDIQFTSMTHLGNILTPGDVVLGYDLTNANYNVDEEGEEVLSRLPHALPDVVLVRKCYERKGDRVWRLKKLETEKGDGRPGEGDDADYEADLEDFMQQVEGDKEMRQQMNLYRNSKAVAAAAAAAAASLASGAMEEEDEAGRRHRTDDEELRLEELLEDMELQSDRDEPASAAGVDESERRQRNARHLAELRVLSEEEAAATAPTVAFDLTAPPSADTEDDI